MTSNKNSTYILINYNVMDVFITVMPLSSYATQMLEK